MAEIAVYNPIPRRLVLAGIGRAGSRFSPGRRALRILHRLFVLAAGFVMVFPFLWMMLNSLKTKDEIWALPPRFFPADPQWQNYFDALADGMFFRYMWNSFYTSALLTVFTLLNSAMFAYAITRIRFRGRNTLFILVMLT
jgi:multiple sugar transport system permease protein